MKRILIITALIIGISSTSFAGCLIYSADRQAYKNCLEQERQQQQMKQMQENQQRMMRQQQQIMQNQQRQQRQNNTVTVPQPQYVDPTGFMKPFQRTW